MRKVAGRLRLELAQYRALAAFAQFGSDLDKATQQQLARGARLTELLKQGQYAPLSVERQIVILYAATNGYIDALPIESLTRYERELFSFIDAKHPTVWKELQAKGNNGKEWDNLVAQLRKVLAEFGKQFAPEVKS